MATFPMWPQAPLLIITFTVASHIFLHWQKKNASEVGNRPLDRGKITGKAATFPFLKRTQTAHRSLWCFAIIGSTCFVLAIALINAMTGPVQGSTGLGNWLFKAKWLLRSESWPADYLAHGGHNRHVAYPPGLPLLSAWCSWFMGGVNLFWIGALSVIYATAAFFLAATCLRPTLRGWTALAGLIFLFTSYYGQVAILGFYAEPLLLFGMSIVLCLLVAASEQKADTNLCPLIIALGALALMKQEGSVLFLLLAGGLWLFAPAWQFSRKKIILLSTASFAIFILPWRLYLWVNNAQSENFSLSRALEPGSTERLQQAAEAYWEKLWIQGEYFGSAWFLLPLAFYFALRHKNPLSCLLMLTAPAYLLIVILSMTASIQPDFTWHLAAADRVLLLPSMLLLVAYGSDKRNSSETMPHA